MTTLTRAVMALFAVFVLVLTWSSNAAERTSPTSIGDLPSNSVIVFGELHGSNEIPAFFADQVEILLKAGHGVHVGLEMSASDQDGLRAAMTLPDPERRRALLELEQWRAGRDGRNSVAMARMLGRLGKLGARFGNRLSLFSFDIAYDWRGEANDRDRFMAETIGRQRQAIPDADYLLVLVGNAHAFGVPGAPWDPTFRSMTVQLEESHPVISLRNLQSGGEAWMCTPECGPRKVLGLDQSRSRAIYLEPFEMDWSDQSVYDGVFFVGELSPSEPLPVAAGLTRSRSRGH